MKIVYIIYLSIFILIRRTWNDTTCNITQYAICFIIIDNIASKYIAKIVLESYLLRLYLYSAYTWIGLADGMVKRI